MAPGHVHFVEDLERIRILILFLEPLITKNTHIPSAWYLLDEDLGVSQKLALVCACTSNFLASVDCAVLV